MPSRVFSLDGCFIDSRSKPADIRRTVFGSRSGTPSARAPPGTLDSLWEDRSSVFPKDSLVHWEAYHEGIFHETARGPQVSL